MRIHIFVAVILGTTGQFALGAERYDARYNSGTPLLSQLIQVLAAHHQSQQQPTWLHAEPAPSLRHPVEERLRVPPNSFRREPLVTTPVPRPIRDSGHAHDARTLGDRHEFGHDVRSFNGRFRGDEEGRHVRGSEPIHRARAVPHLSIRPFESERNHRHRIAQRSHDSHQRFGHGDADQFAHGAHRSRSLPLSQQFRPGDIVTCPVPLFSRVKVDDAKNIAPYAIPVVVAVRDPHCRQAINCVFVRVFVPDRPCGRVDVGDRGRRVKLDYGKYEVKIEADDGRIEIEYED